MKGKVIGFSDFATACPFFDSAFEHNGYGCTLGDNLDEHFCSCSACPLGFALEEDDLKEAELDWSEFCEIPNAEDIGEDEYIVIDTTSEREETKEALKAYENYLNRYEP